MHIENGTEEIQPRKRPARPSAATKNQGRDAAKVTDAPTHARNEGNLATDTHGLNTDDLLRCAPARLTLSVFNPCVAVAKNSLCFSPSSGEGVVQNSSWRTKKENVCTTDRNWHCLLRVVRGPLLN